MIIHLYLLIRIIVMELQQRHFLRVGMTLSLLGHSLKKVIRFHKNQNVLDNKDLLN